MIHIYTVRYFRLFVGTTCCTGFDYAVSNTIVAHLFDYQSESLMFDPRRGWDFLRQGLSYDQNLAVVGELMCLNDPESYARESQVSW